MAEQEEPLYDFPEPSQTSKFKGHQRTRGSLRSISVLDRLLLTVPVWLQLSINPATALHILQREPPGTFLVRNSRTSQKKVLCVRLADNSEPSFVQQFDIKEEPSTFSLVTSAISFPDLPRLISFYCVSRDVLPFPLELPEAIARATSHKELESISHMGIEFWSSHLNVRGPRETPKPQKERKPDSPPTVPNPPIPQTAPDVQPKPENQTKPDTQPSTASEPPPPKEDSNTALFNEFCPLKTRGPNEVNYGSGIGALCFINPLFLQSLNAWSRRRMFKRSLKIRVSTESSTLLSPPLAPPPPPPLMPKSKARCKAGKQDRKGAQSVKESANILQAEMLDQKEEDYAELPSRTKEDMIKVIKEVASLPTVMESLVEESDYMQPSPAVNFSNPLSPYLSPNIPQKKSKCLSPCGSPGTSPSVSPYQSPSPSPKVPFPLSPFTSDNAYDIPTPSSKTELSQVEDKRAKKAHKKQENVQTHPATDKDHLKVLISPESFTSPSSPLLMPKSKDQSQNKKAAQSIKDTTLHQKAQTNPTAEEDYAELSSRIKEDMSKVIEEAAPPPIVIESRVEESDYAQPSPAVSFSCPLSPYLCPKIPQKKSKSLSPCGSPGTSPSVSPYQSPSPSPKVPFPLSPFTSDNAYDIPTPSSKTELSQVEDKRAKEAHEKEENEETNTASLIDKVNISTESFTSPSAPQLMPKSKDRNQNRKAAQSIKDTTLDQKAQTNPTAEEDYAALPSRTKEDLSKVIEEAALPPTLTSVNRMADAYDIPTPFLKTDQQLSQNIRAEEACEKEENELVQ